MQDLFYLTLEEVEAAIRGANVTRDLQELIALRKRDYKQYETETAASRIVTRGIVQGTLFGGKSTASASLMQKTSRWMGARAGFVGSPTEPKRDLSRQIAATPVDS